MAQIPKLDRRIIALIEERKNAEFIVRELRDQYAKAEVIRYTNTGHSVNTSVQLICPWAVKPAVLSYTHYNVGDYSHP